MHDSLWGCVQCIWIRKAPGSPICCHYRQRQFHHLALILQNVGMLFVNKARGNRLLVGLFTVNRVEFKKRPTLAFRKNNKHGKEGRSAKVDLRSILQIPECILLFLGPAQHTDEDTGPKSPSLSEAIGQCHHNSISCPLLAQMYFVGYFL